MDYPRSWKEVQEPHSPTLTQPQPWTAPAMINPLVAMFNLPEQPIYGMQPYEGATLTASTVTSVGNNSRQDQQKLLPTCLVLHLDDREAQ